MTQQLTKMKMMLAAVAMLAAMVSGAIPAAFAQEGAEEIAVTGVVNYEGTKADGTPIYGITEESTPGEERYQKEGYLMEGDYSAYVGQRVTVYGVPRHSGEVRVLDVTRIV